MSRLSFPILVIILICTLPCTNLVRGSAREDSTSVFVLATLYSRHNATPVYNLDTLRRLIRSIEPDVLVLDVNPAELKDQKVFPSKIEYPGVIFPLMNERKWPAYAAEPAEPMFTEIVEAVKKAHADFHSGNPTAATAMEQFERSLFAVLKTAWHTPADVNSAATDQALAGKRALEDKLIGPVDADGERRWAAHIVQVTLQAAKEHPGKRVLVLIGIGNCHKVRSLLSANPAVRLVDMEAWLRDR